MILISVFYGSKHIFCSFHLFHLYVFHNIFSKIDLFYLYTSKQLDYLWKILKMYEVPLYAVKRVIDDLSDFVD